MVNLREQTENLVFCMCIATEIIVVEQSYCVTQAVAMAIPVCVMVHGMTSGDSSDSGDLDSRYMYSSRVASSYEWVSTMMIKNL
jgi:hypothetical protein